MALNTSFKQQVILQQGGNITVNKRFAKWLYPSNAERIYERQLVRLFKDFNRFIKENIYPSIETLINEVQFLRPDQATLKLDSWVDNVATLYKATQFYYDNAINSQVETITTEQASRISVYNKQQFIKVIQSAVQVNPLLQEPYLQTQIKAFQVNNASLITKLSQEQASKMQETLYRNLSAGNGAKTIKEELEKGFDIGINRARLIARDQTNKFNGNLTQLRQEELGINQYHWSTSRDERVRVSHKENEGKSFTWNSSPSNTGHPGYAIRCRCTAQPVITQDMFSD